MKSLSSLLKEFPHNFREFFWPLLEIEKTNEQAVSAPTPEFELKVSIENLDQALTLTTKISENEEDRRKGIESKASLFIGTISVATSIVVAANSMVVSNTNYGISMLISVALSFVLSIYAARTVWFAIKALERGNYSVLGMKEINFEGNKQDFQKHLIINLVKMRKSNMETINNKVDNVTMAQEYYKRAIIMICIYSLHILIQCIFKYQFSECLDIHFSLVKSFS